MEHQATIESVVFSNTLHKMIREVYFSQYRPLVLREWSPGTTQSKWDRIEQTLYPLLHSEMFHMSSSQQSNRVLKSQFDGFGKETIKDDGPDVLQMLAKVAVNVQPNKIVKFRKPKQHIDRRYGGISYG